MENKRPKPTEKNNNSKGPVIALLILFLLAGGLAGYLFSEKGRLEQELITCEQAKGVVIDEKSVVISELETMLTKYDTLSAENEEMQEELLAERSKIEKLLEEAKQKNWTIAKLKKETATLRDIMQDYVRTIDSLNTLTINLREEKEVISKELGSEKSKNNELSQQNEGLASKVKIGQRLEALDILVIPQRVKSNNVHRETSKADKTNKIKVCFTLDKNEIAEAGNRDIYVRIIAPDATILAANDDTDGRFEFNGVNGYYSLKRKIEYGNAEQDECFYYEVTEDIPVGKYICEIYENDSQIGKLSFELK